MNANITEFMGFKQEGAIVTQKLIDEFAYFGSNILSTECVVNIRIENVWTAIDRLSIIWKSLIYLMK